MADDVHNADAVPDRSDSPANSSQEIYDMGHGHFFIKKTFHKPTYCHHCTDMLWGLIQQGYVCEVCNFVVHDKCLKTVVSACSSIATSLIKNPVAHCWSEPGHFKRKFCNVCRKRLEDSQAIRCEKHLNAFGRILDGQSSEGQAAAMVYSSNHSGQSANQLRCCIKTDFLPLRPVKPDVS